MMKKFAALMVVLALVVAFAPAASRIQAQEKVTLVIESWRNDDLVLWEDVIIPAFNAHYPDIEVIFAPAAPAEYNAALNAKLEGGTAGDLITCRPFDLSLGLFNKGYLLSLNDLPGMEHFGDVARSAWITDDGSDVFCVPMASVIHGFMYNVDIFEELGLEVPVTEAEFFDVLQAIKDAGYTPLAMGTHDLWEAATMGYQNIGPTYWKGEEGRLGLINGTIGYNEDGFLEAFKVLARWAPYLPDGYQAITYSDAQNMFTVLEEAAIYPTGSWEIGVFGLLNPDLNMSAFKPPVVNEGDTCYISDHVDIAMGVNAASPNKEAALTFLEWMTTQEFAQIYSDALPGFFSLSDHELTLENPVAQEFISWRGQCETTIRSSYQILSRGVPNNENDLWLYSAEVLNGTLSPEEAADIVQEHLASWYEPQMNR
ncbi:MAG: carbohydrate ABC transporter substrate-binding protein [Chloroflexota bacterium]|jgi:raffinose/stachyose/melibiose transport system substrate-binding protein